MTRKLATIFAADIAQYSAHIESNETAALSHLRELRMIMDPLIAGNGGHIANTAGDSVRSKPFWPPSKPKTSMSATTICSRLLNDYAIG